MATYTGAVTRRNWEKHGERPSVLDFGAVGDGTTDDTTAFQDAIDAMQAKGGGYIWVPAQRNYSVGEISIPNKVILIGEGDDSVMARRSTIPDGRGWINIEGTAAGIEALQLDGNIAAVTGLQYGTGTSDVLFNNDPMDSKLTQNTSVWVHPGSDDFWMSAVTVRHTGGYAVLFDVRSGDTSNGQILDCTFENNRPHLFGTDTADLNYGAWTGGVFVKGDCRSNGENSATTDYPYAMRGLTVRGCTFYRCNGNCVWSHSDGFGAAQHQNFQLTNNVFRYIGRDGYMVGNVEGGCAQGSMEYVGFVHYTDTDAPVGSYLGDNYAVGFDAAGYVSNFVFGPGSVTEFYGGGVDLDGVRHSVVTGITLASSQSIAKGIQTGDSNDNDGGHNVHITGCRIDGCGAGAIVLKQGYSCLVEANHINHPAAATQLPITIYSINLGATQNVIRNNLIYYDAAQFCVYEQDGGTGYDSTVVNYVYGNSCLGAASYGEFLKNAASSSKTGFSLYSNSSSIATRNETFIQREGATTTSALKFYSTLNTTTKQLAQLADYRGTGTSDQDATLNVSYGGTSTTGIIATGSKTTFGYGNLMASGKFLGYGFFGALSKDHASTEFIAAEADALNADWGLLRYDGSNARWEQSVSTSAGTRVWAVLGGGSGSPAGADTYIQINSLGTFYGEAALTWDYTNNRLGVGAAATGATAEVSGNLWALATHTGSIVVIVKGMSGQTGNLQEWRDNSGTSLVAIDPSGHLYQRGFTQFYAMAAPAVSGATQGRIYFDSTDNVFKVSENGGAYVNLIGAGGVAGAADEVQFRDGGAFGADSVFVWDKTNNRLGIGTATPGASLEVRGNAWVLSNSTSNIVAIVQGTSGQTGNLQEWRDSAGTALVAIDSAGNFFERGAMQFYAMAAPGVSSAATGRIYFDSTANKFKVSEHGGAYVNLVAGSPGGSDTYVQYNDAGAFGGESGLVWNKTTNVLTVTGTAATAGIVAATCYIQSQEGFYTTSSSATAVNVPSGGVTALSHIGARNDGDSAFVLSRTSATAREYGFGIDSSGNFILRDRTAGANRLTMGTTGSITIGSTLVVDQSGNITMTGVLNCNGASGGVNVSSNSAYNAIQASNNGGMAARSFTATKYIQVGQNSGAPTATTSDSLNDGCLYYDTSSNKLKVRVSSSFVDVATGSAGVTSLNSLTGALSIVAGNNISVTPSGSNVTVAISPPGVGSEVMYRSSGQLGSDTAFSYSSASIRLTINGINGTAALNVSGGRVEAADGYTIGSTQIFNSSRQWATGAGAFNPSSSGAVSLGDSSHYWTTLYVNTSIVHNGTTRLDSSGNASFVNCNVTGSYQMDSSDVINSSRQFVGAGALCGASGIGAGGFNPWNAGLGSYESGQTGTITLSGVTSITVRGGVITGWS